MNKGNKMSLLDILDETNCRTIFMLIKLVFLIGLSGVGLFVNIEMAKRIIEYLSG
jgi:hypothetical protein